MNKDARYIKVHREFIENPYVPLLSKGMYSFLLSLPFQWEGTWEELESISGTERLVMEEAFFDLLTNGYLTCEPIRDGDHFSVEYTTKVRGEETWECQIITLIQK